MISSIFSLLTDRTCHQRLVRSGILICAVGLPVGSHAQAISVPVTPAQAIEPVVKPLNTPVLPDTQTPVAPTTDGAVDQAAKAEILATFQREARAAYAQAKQACQDLPKDQQTVCLAKARIQFDQDMQYAQKRADMGF